MATHFNAAYHCDVLRRPEPKLNQARVVPGIDGQKMSKSYGNTIDLFDTPKKMRKRIMSIKTDSTPLEDRKDPDGCSVFTLYKLVAEADEVDALARRYRAGGMGYGEAKEALFQTVERFLGPARDRRAKLASDVDYVEDVLCTSGRRARAVARAVMEEVRAACGITVAAC